MKKKTFKKRFNCLMKATNICLFGWQGESRLVQRAMKPLTGKSIRRLLGDGMYGYLGSIEFPMVDNYGWYFDYPRFSNKRKYNIRFDDENSEGTVMIYIDRARDARYIVDALLANNRQ